MKPMKAKTIKQVLNKKLKDWLASIDDKEVHSLVKKNTIITGGCITSMLMGEDVNDFDIYFTNEKTVTTVAQYYIKKFLESRKLKEFEGIDTYDIELIAQDGRVKLRVKNNSGNSRVFRPACEEGFQFSDEPGDEAENFEDVVTHVEDTSNEELPKYRPVYLSANAITLSDQVQIVIRFYGDADTIHENFDFNHCKCHWQSKENKLTLPQDALEAIVTKELIYTGSKYPLASIIRTRKFIHRGWSVNAGQFLKMCLQLNDLNLRDIEVLEDQLIGMDAAYFSQIMASIPENRKVDGKVDTKYIIELINRFF